MIYVGIDPGLSGFMAAIEDGLIRFEATPTINVGKKKTKREYNIQEMKETLVVCKVRAGREGIYVILEKQQSFPGQGVSSTFSIGRGFGLWEGLIVGLGLPYTIVHPRTWKKEMLRDVPGDDQKGRSILAAQRLFPNVDLRRSERARKPDHNKAEALLLAEYGRRILEKRNID